MNGLFLTAPLGVVLLLCIVAIFVEAHYRHRRAQGREIQVMPTTHRQPFTTSTKKRRRSS